MIFIILLLISALSVSAVAGWFSIVGLMAIFPGNAVPILTMGVVLEVAKLVTASWLYRNWKTAKVLIKSYFTVAVVVLSLITSMGIYGFLSKAHIDQTVNAGGTNELQVETLERRIAYQQKVIKDSETVLAQLDTTVETLIEYDRIRGPDGAIATRESQSEERANLNQQITSAYMAVEEIQAELLPLQKEQLSLEAEVGPLKYIAELLYGESAGEVLDKAVRFIVILIVLVFDPLAILLVIAANMSWMQRKGEQVTFLDDSALTKETESFNIQATEKEQAPEEEIVELSETEVDQLQRLDRSVRKKLDWLIDKKRKGE